jgi:hypothetical protein
MVEVGALVEEVGIVREHVEAVGKAGRHPQHAVVGRAQPGSEPLPQGRRAAPQVHRDIEHLAHHHPHQLALRLLGLVVQAAQDAVCRTAVVVLHEVEVETGGAKGVGIPALEEKAPLIAEHAWFKQVDVGQWRGFKFHPTRSRRH